MTVSGAPDEQASEIGGLQNTVTNLGASLGTALAGSILFSVLASSLLVSLPNIPGLSEDVQQKATVTLSSGVPIVSDAQLSSALEHTSLTSDQQQAVLKANDDARLRALRASLLGIAIVELLAIFAARRLPKTPMSGPPAAVGEESAPLPS